MFGGGYLGADGWDKALPRFLCLPGAPHCSAMHLHMAFAPASSHQPVLTHTTAQAPWLLPVPPLQLAIPHWLLEEGWHGSRVTWRALWGRGTRLDAPGLGLVWPYQCLPRLGAAMGVAESTGNGRVPDPQGGASVDTKGM